MNIVLAVNPILEVGGQIAAIIICIFILIFILVTVGLHFGLAFALAWVRQKTELIKRVRPKVETINKTTTAAVEGTPPAETAHPVVQAVANVPARVQAVDKRVDATHERVAKTVIEVRARTVQVQTVIKTFLLPGLMVRKSAQTPQQEGLEFNSPGYRALMEERASQEPAVVGAGNEREEYAAATSSAQLKNVPSR